MFYLIDTGLDYADIGFGDPEQESEKIIKIFDEDFDPSVRYKLTKDGYEKVARFFQNNIFNASKVENTIDFFKTEIDAT